MTKVCFNIVLICELNNLYCWMFLCPLLWFCIFDGFSGKYVFTGDKEVCNTIGQVNWTAHLLPNNTKVNKLSQSTAWQKIVEKLPVLNIVNCKRSYGEKVRLKLNGPTWCHQGRLPFALPQWQFTMTLSKRLPCLDQILFIYGIIWKLFLRKLQSTSGQRKIWRHSFSRYVEMKETRWLCLNSGLAPTRRHRERCSMSLTFVPTNMVKIQVQLPDANVNF